MKGATKNKAAWAKLAPQSQKYPLLEHSKNESLRVLSRFIKTYTWSTIGVICASGNSAVKEFEILTHGVQLRWRSPPSIYLMRGKLQKSHSKQCQ
ncbi:MAG: hypothetical protein PUP92_23945 [Rhizonema sp. PD38]|nr:hypothetical protein [Rhizonema sp. PD38]